MTMGYAIADEQEVDEEECYEGRTQGSRDQ